MALFDLYSQPCLVRQGLVVVVKDKLYPNRWFGYMDKLVPLAFIIKNRFSVKGV